MPRDLMWDEPDDDWEEDGFEEFDDDLAETVNCPNCGAEIYEDAVRCPACGEYVTHDTRAWSGRPTWWIVLGLLGILAAIVTFILM